MIFDAFHWGVAKAVIEFVEKNNLKLNGCNIDWWIEMLSVIITTKNNALTIKKCIERVLETPPKDKEVIVVYGKSKDGTEEIIKQFEGKIKIIEDNEGTGSAINTGVLNSKGDIIFYIEGHSFVSKDAFLKVLRGFEENSEVGYIIFYRYIPNNVKFNKVQKLMNFWRKSMKGSTMGQFRAFRRKTFFDVGGFWIFPKCVDDLEFATRMSRTKWKKMVLNLKCWDYPRTNILSIFKHEFDSGAGESCWFHLYKGTDYAKKEYKIKGNNLVILKHLYKCILKRIFYAPLYAIKIGVKERYLSFFPFYTICCWSYVLGFIYGQLKYWDNEKWDKRVFLLNKNLSSF